jgi:hypothetical protein
VRQPRLRATLSATALAAVVSLARADAPPDQYVLFNSGSLTIADQYTNLVWQRTVPMTQYDFWHAATYCQGLSLDGFSNWRVPSYKELLTLVDENPHFEYEYGSLVPHAIDPNAFPATPVGSPYWTSSMYPADTTRGSAYAVDFGTGTGRQEDLKVPLDVRCVH